MDSAGNQSAAGAEPATNKAKRNSIMGLFDTFRKTATTKSADGSGTSRKSSSATSNQRTPGDRQEDVIFAGESRVIEQRLLFIDVDVGWFQTAERELLRLEPKWGCQSVGTIEQAVAALEKESYHALVLSAALANVPALNTVLASQAPALVRIVLCSGNDRAETARWNAAGLHPLPLTTDGANLAAQINRIARVQEWLTDAGMKKLLAQCRKLPAMPKLYSQVTAELASPNGSIDVVAQHIAQDPVMTAKLLQVVNSAFFALGREVANATEAVMFLGAERTRSLILLAGVFTQFDNVKCPGFSTEQIWNHSLQVGNLARTVAMAETKDAKIAEAAFTAGLVHDMGKLILAANVPAMCQAVEQIHTNKQVSQREAELQMLGTTHAELAACLMGNWALPLPVLEAVAWHHTPTRSADKGFSLLTAVHAANVFAYELGCGTGGSALPEKFDHAYLDQIDLGDRRNEWRKACNVPAKQEEDGEYARLRARRAAKRN